MYKIVEFDKSRAEDYLIFFDKESPNGVVCYCTQWNMTQAEIDERIISPIKENQSTLSQISREVAREMIREDKIHGYLAYEETSPVGWCNCDDKGNYAFLARHVAPGAEKGKIKSIVCLKVIGERNFLEVGTELLRTICEKSRSEGYSFIEVYPHKGAMTCADFGEAIQLYQDNGFQQLSLKDGEAVLRKKL